MSYINEKVAEYQRYQGISPKPEDFDDYWNTALREMKAVDADPALVPADFQIPNVECFDLYFNSVKGARIHAKYLRPAHADHCPVVLQFHGYCANSGDWYDKMAFVLQGFSVAALDCRGQGFESEDTNVVKGTTFAGHIIRGVEDPDPHNLLFRDIFLDTAKLAEVVMNFKEVDSSRVYAMGGSQGGGLTVACTALVPEVRMAFAMYPFLADYKKMWELGSPYAYEELKTYFRLFDPLHQREDRIFDRLGYIDIQNLAPRIQASKVYFYTALMDECCLPVTQFSVYNKIKAPKEMILYPDFGHEALPGAIDHTLRHMVLDD